MAAGDVLATADTTTAELAVRSKHNQELEDAREKSLAHERELQATGIWLKDQLQLRTTELEVVKLTGEDAPAEAPKVGQMTVTKQKDGEDGFKITYRMESVTLSATGLDEARQSLVVVPDDEAKGQRRKPMNGTTRAVFKALEIGHIFKLGTKYSESLKATVLDADGKAVPIVMGSYGIGVERILAAAIELHHDDFGIRWPLTIAPFQATVLTLGPEPELTKAAEQLVAELEKAGVEVLFDDREERAGVKFKDADLVGVPIRIAVGKKGLAEGKAEWKLRGSKQVELVPLADVPAKAAAAVRAAAR